MNVVGAHFFMADGRERTTRLRWWAIIGVGLTGAAILFVDHYWINSEPLEHLGAAMVIACLLGASIDWWYKREIAEEVFHATIGYIMPEAFRDQLRWIYSHKVLCERHDQNVKLKVLRFDTVEMECEIRRKFRNISNSTVDVSLGIAIDEWFNTNYQSQITQFSYSHRGCTINVPSSKLNIPTAKREPSVRIKPQKVELKKEEYVECWYTFKEYKKINDGHIVHFGSPTESPEVTVDADNRLDWEVRFPRESEVEKKEVGKKTFRYDGVLLPTQEIRIRWWNKSQADSWRNRPGEQRK